MLGVGGGGGAEGEGGPGHRDIIGVHFGGTKTAALM